MSTLDFASDSCQTEAGSAPNSWACSLALRITDLLLSAVPVCRHPDAGRHRLGGLRGRAGHGSLRLVSQQQHHICVERTQSGSRGHPGMWCSPRPLPSLPHPLTSELPGYPFELLIKGTNVLSNGSFLLQTPDEMGHLSSINGCGVRSCDSLWEKRTNVSRDFFLCVRAEESLPINRLGRAPFARGSGLMAPAT